MSAIDKMKELYKDRSEPTKWALGDTIESRANLELAERLEKLEGASKPAPAESPQQPFRVDRDGIYSDRQGREVRVKINADPTPDGYVADGLDDDYFAYQPSGGLWPDETSDYDLVAYIGPLPRAERQSEFAGFYTSRFKYLEIVSPHESPTAYGPYDDTSECGEESLVIDVSKIGDDAIVQRGPEPKPSPELKQKEAQIKRLRDAITATDRAAQDLQVYSSVGDPDVYYEKAKALVKAARAAGELVKGEG